MFITTAEALQVAEAASPLLSLTCEAEYAQRSQEEAEETAAGKEYKVSAVKQVLVMGGGIILLYGFVSAAVTLYEKN